MNLEGLKVSYDGEKKFVTYNGCPTVGNSEGEIIRTPGGTLRQFKVYGHVQMRGLISGQFSVDENEQPITIFSEPTIAGDMFDRGQKEAQRTDVVVVQNKPVPISRGMGLVELRKTQ